MVSQKSSSSLLSLHETETMRKGDNEIEESQRHEVPPYYTWIRHVRGKKTLAEVAIALAYVLMVAVVSLPITNKTEVKYMKRKK